MKTDNKFIVALLLLTFTVDAMAQGSPGRVAWMIGGAIGGGLIGFLLGLWWCRHCHDKQRGDKPDHPNDR
jgi:hypothetical protein